MIVFEVSLHSGGFYEWQGERGSKRRFRIHRVDDDVFAFAGIWETWTSNGDELSTVWILTTEPNEIMEPIHDRMPVTLEGMRGDIWLTAEDTDELQRCSIHIQTND